MLALVGRSVGDNWEQWRHNLGYLDYVVLAAIVGGVVYFLIKRRRGGGPGEEEPTATPEPVRSAGA
jgi:membrane protein DedA with SNARE-associated domain